MKILALEFSSSQRSVAVVQTNARGNFAESEVMETGGRGVNAISMMSEALRQAEIEREQIEIVVVGIGPGSYMGIRGAIAVAQGWQLARRVKLLGISSVECIAAQAQSEDLVGRVNVIVDAQRQEFYLASYEISAEKCREIVPLRIATMREIREMESAEEILIGPEVTRWFPNGKIIFPRATMLGRMAAEKSNFIRGEELEPIYLREAKFVKAPPPRIVP